MALTAMVGNNVNAMTQFSHGIRMKSIDTDNAAAEIESGFKKLNQSAANLQQNRDKDAFAKLHTELASYPFKSVLLNTGAYKAVLNSPNLKEVFESDTQAKALEKAIKIFEKGLASDIKEIFKQTIVSSNPLSVLQGSTDKTSLEKLLSLANGDSEFDAIFKTQIFGKMDENALKKIQYATKETESITDALTNLASSINAAFQSATTTVNINSQSVDLAPLAEKIQMGINTTIGKALSEVSKLKVLDTDQVKEINKVNYQINLVNILLGKNYMGNAAPLLQKFNSNMYDFIKNIETAKAAFITAASQAGADATAKEGAFMTFLHDAFGQKKNASSASSDVFFFKVKGSADGKVAKDNQVTDNEALLAGFGDTSHNDPELQLSEANRQGKGDTATAETLFNTLLGSKFASLLNKLSGAVQPKENRDIARAKLLDRNGIYSVPEFPSKTFSNMDKADVTDYVKAVEDFVSKNKGKANFSALKETIQNNLLTFQKGFEDYVATLTIGLYNNTLASPQNGMYKGQNKAYINNELAQITARIAKISTEMGQIIPPAGQGPAGQGPADPAPAGQYDIKDLLPLIFQQDGEISADLGDVKEYSKLFFEDFKAAKPAATQEDIKKEAQRSIEALLESYKKKFPNATSMETMAAKAKISTIIHEGFGTTETKPALTPAQRRVPARVARNRLVRSVGRKAKNAKTRGKSQDSSQNKKGKKAKQTKKTTTVRRGGALNIAKSAEVTAE